MQFFQVAMPHLPLGVEDTEGWAFKRARTCEVTLSPEEILDACDEGVDIRAIWQNARDKTVRSWCVGWRGAVRFNGRWFVPLTRTAVASGLDPASNPGEFIALDDAECMALERVVSHWSAQS